MVLFIIIVFIFGKNTPSARRNVGRAQMLFVLSSIKNKLLQFLGVVRFDGLGLDYYCRIATGERAALGGDSAGDVARGESKCHGDGGSDGHNQVLNGLLEALFLNIG